ncbi:Uncharacterised protein [BD1-7 clade bacterium]|uniref:Transporter n=1 Tax=BD1-7 clade bacterium TaxID=2029982 RepID=A0A5S9QAT8_9GAMM|nr:Uncharacterised protein [BD1-7 clade bacterium]
MAATGSAVGLGNVWKFPYVAGENGGGAFVLIYLLCIAVVGLPILIGEIMLGRHGASNPFSAMIKSARESDASKLWAGTAILGIVAGLIIMSFYSLVAGWVLDYTVAMANGQFTGADAAVVDNYFNNVLLGDQKLQLAWHSAFTLITVAVLAGGVIKGLGNSIKIMMPLLFVLLLVSFFYSLNQGDFARGLHFMFDADFSKINAETVLIAMGQAFFTLSLGMSAMMAYGSYMPKSASIARTAIVICILDTGIAILAGLTIFPIVFAHGIEPSQGPGLMFLSIPLAFGNMPGGEIFGTLFFVLIAIAAWSSAISLVEPAVAWLSENTRLNRPVSAAIVGSIVWAGGTACIYVDGVFDQFDYIASNVLLPLGGLLIAIFCGWIMKRKIAKRELGDLSFNQFNLWYATTRVFTPVGVIAVLLFSTGIVKFNHDEALDLIESPANIEAPAADAVVAPKLEAPAAGPASQPQAAQ